MKPSPRRVTFSGLAAKARATKRSRMIDEAVRLAVPKCNMPAIAYYCLPDAVGQPVEIMWAHERIAAIRAEFRRLSQRK